MFKYHKCILHSFFGLAKRPSNHCALRSLWRRCWRHLLWSNRLENSCLQANPSTLYSDSNRFSCSAHRFHSSMDQRWWCDWRKSPLIRILDEFRLLLLLLWSLAYGPRACCWIDFPSTAYADKWHPNFLLDELYRCNDLVLFHLPAVWLRGGWFWGVGRRKTPTSL